MIRLALIACLVALGAAWDSPGYSTPKNFLSKIQESVDFVKNYDWSSAPKDLPKDESCYGELGCYEVGKGCTGYVPLALPHGPDFLDTKFYTYVKSNHYTHVIDYSEDPDLSMIPEGASVAMIVHGWTMNGKDNPLIVKICHGLARHFDVVMAVDWWKGASAGGLYAQSVRDTEVVAAQMALMVDRLQKKRGVDGSKVLVSGFSLGGQIVGYVGRRLRDKYQIELDRIVPIDPAGPLFEGFGCTVAPSDAKWVTVIHTSGGWDLLIGELGMFSPVGHIDWYPNGGNRQPGCGQLVVDTLICHHYRACELFAASLDHYCAMNTYPCASWDDYRNGKCSHVKSDSEFGWPATRSAGGPHYFNTTDHYPFCEGH